MRKFILFLTLLLILAFGAVADADTGDLVRPKKIPYTTQIDRPNYNEKAPCYWLGYYGSPAYSMPVPTADGVMEFAQRFSTSGVTPETLMTVEFFIYNDGDPSYGNNDIYVTIYSDDGSGLPGSALAQVTLAAGTYSAYPDWTVIDFSGNNLVFNGDFHVAVSTNAAPGTDDEKILLDDGSVGAGRASAFYSGVWWPMYNLYGMDFNFVIDVYLCTELSGWNPGDPHKMHFPQLPDEDGWDVNATYPIILADDWMCSETGYVKDIHFWGSWKDDLVGVVDSFILSIHSDIPAGVIPSGTTYNYGDCNNDGVALSVADLVELSRYVSSTVPPRPFHYRYDFNGDCVIDEADVQVFSDYFTYGLIVFGPYGGYPIPTCGEATYYSRPGETLWEAAVYDYNMQAIDPPTAEGWYNPSQGEIIYENHWSYFQYDVYLPNNLWFWQKQGTIYWLNITAFVSGGAEVKWGWKSSEDHWNDDAVWSYAGHLNWKDIIEPNGYPYRPGDVDDDGDVDMDDILYLQDYYYGIGPPPPYEVNGFYPAADVDGDCSITTSDLVYLVNYVQAGGAPPLFCPTYTPDAKYNDFSARFDTTGTLVEGTGTEYYGEGWYFYPWYGWWNIWFYDHPFDTTRMKTIRVIVDAQPDDSTQPASINLAVNWSTDLWSLDYPGIEAPPLPGEDEDSYIGRRSYLETELTDSIHYEFDVVLPWYNPEWVSIDVIAQNAVIRGTIKHACVQSLDLAFVITGDSEGPPPLHEGEVSLHNIDDYVPPMGDPIGTQWHELFPEYCQMWTLTSWFDNNDGVLSFCDYVDFTNNDTQEWRKFHVEWVGPTLTVSVDQTDRYIEYICNDYPNIEPITQPIGTYWHEVYPTYCQIWVIIDWVDNGNGYLDFCDYITIRNWITGEEITVHVEAVDCDLLLNEIKPEPPNPLPDGTNYHNETGDIPDVGNPIGSQWHELYPEYCQSWTLTSWFDNGSGKLDSCDYVDFTNNATEEWKKFHVEWIGPTVTVERIESDFDTVYFDMVGRDGVDFFWDTVANPVGSYWHEVFPVYCQNYYCVRWEDTNDNGIVDAGDFLVFQNLQTGEFERVRVISVEIDIILNEVIPPDPLPEGINLHNEGDYMPPDPEVINTVWSELHPDFGMEWVITSFVDNGDGYLGPGDSIDFNQDSTKYYVEWIGPTIEVEDPQYEISFWDYTGMASPPWGSNFEVRGSYWHAIYPPQSYCHDLIFVDWIDNYSGELDSCDYIIVQDLVTGEFETYHVLGLKTDIIISETEVPCDCLPGDANGTGNYNILDVTYLIAYLYKGGPAPMPYQLCSGDANCNCAVNILDVTFLISYLYKGGPSPCTCEQWLINCGPPLRIGN